MKIKDYTDLAKTATAENFQTVITSILDSIKEDFSVIDNLNEQIKTQENKIRDLQDTNQKLFLSQTGGTPKQEEDDIDDGIEGIAALDAVSESIKADNPDKVGINILQ